MSTDDAGPARGRRRWIALGLAVVVVAALAFFPGRRLAENLRVSACHDTSSDGAAVALGDSITIGSGDPAWGFHAEDSWFGQLICAADAPVEYGYNAGIFAETTAQMLERLGDDVLAREPSTVFVLGGTNDVVNIIDPNETIAHLREIAERSRDAGAAVYLGTIPPQEGPERREMTADLNARIVGLGGELDLPVIDFHAALVDADGSFRPGLNRDPLHPSPAGAEAMAQAARDALG